MYAERGHQETKNRSQAYLDPFFFVLLRTKTNKIKVNAENINELHLVNKAML